MHAEPRPPRVTLRDAVAVVGCIVLFLVCGCAILGLTSDRLWRALEFDDRGVELLRVSAEAAPGEGPDTAGYSIRVLKPGLVGTGEACVAITSWRYYSENKRTIRYRVWRPYEDTLSCRWPRLTAGEGWLAARIAFPLPDGSGRHAFYAVVPDGAERARVTWPDGTARQVATRTVEGYEGRFFALWEPEFGLARHGLRPVHTRIFLYDAAGRPLSVH